MRNVRRNVDEVSGTRRRRELQLITPPHTGATFYDEDYTFELAVMMRTGLGIWVDGNGSRPELGRAGPGVSDRSSAIHPGGLRSVRVELVRTYNSNAVFFPIHFDLICLTFVGPMSQSRLGPCVGSRLPVREKFRHTQICLR